MNVEHITILIAPVTATKLSDLIPVSNIKLREITLRTAECEK